MGLLADYLVRKWDEHRSGLLADRMDELYSQTQPTQIPNPEGVTSYGLLPDGSQGPARQYTVGDPQIGRSEYYDRAAIAATRYGRPKLASSLMTRQMAEEGLMDRQRQDQAYQAHNLTLKQRRDLARNRTQDAIDNSRATREEKRGLAKDWQLASKQTEHKLRMYESAEDTIKSAGSLERVSGPQQLNLITNLAQMNKATPEAVNDGDIINVLSQFGIEGDVAQIKGYLSGGGQLQPQQVAAIMNAINDLGQTAMAQQNRIDATYDAMAQSAGVAPDYRWETPRPGRSQYQWPPNQQAPGGNLPADAKPY